MQIESRNSESGTSLSPNIRMGYLFFVFETWLQL